MVNERSRQEEALKAVERKFALWRSHRKRRGPTPPELLQEIPALSKMHPLGRLAQALGMNYRTLKKASIAEGRVTDGCGPGTKKTKGQVDTFVEIPMPAPSSGLKEFGRMGAIEIETPWGYKARVTAGDDPAGRIEGWLKLLLMAHQ